VKNLQRVRTGVASSLWVSFVALTWLACSSASPRPGELGTCTPLDGAPCTVGGGSGGGGAPGDGGSSESTPSDSETGCGTVAVTTANTTCTSCIEASCCGANLACSGACASLVTCTQGCASTDQTCVSTCFNSWPTGYSAYSDLVNCISGQGCTGCPTLPLQGVADF
jgi:hypothetical protein